MLARRHWELMDLGEMKNGSKPRRRLVSASVLFLALSVGAAWGCGNDKKSQPGKETDTKVGARHGLTAEQAAEVLVQIGDKKITVGEFADELARQSPYVRARYNSPERRREFLDNMVRFELLAAEARRRGYDKLAEVQRVRKQVMIQQLMKEKFEEKIKLSDVSDKEVKAYYEAHPDEFDKPEQIRASHIQIKSPAAAARVLGQVLAKKDDAALFRKLADKHNEDEATKAQQGDLRFFGREPEETGQQAAAGSSAAPPIKVPKAVAKAAFRLKNIGDVHSELVESDAGFHVVKLTGKRAALKRTLEQASRPIRNRLWREKREQAIARYVAELRKTAKVEEFDDALAQVRVPSDDTKAPAAGQ